MKKLQVGSLLVVGLSAQLATAGDITGSVKLTGTAPEEREISTMDPLCRKLHPDGLPTTRFFMTGADGGLADVVVYLKGAAGKSSGAAADPLTLDQTKCEYVPYVAAAQTGQTIRVLNSDPLMHNVHPMPVNKAAGNKEDNKVQMAKAAPLDFSFPAEEMFLKFKCDVHPWMFSYVSIFDHPHFAVTDENGKFKIGNVPAGKYTLVAHHRKANGGKELTKEVEVKADGAMVELALSAK